MNTVMFIALLLAVGSVCAWLGTSRQGNLKHKSSGLSPDMIALMRPEGRAPFGVLERIRHLFKVRPGLRYALANIAEGVHGTGNITYKADAALVRYTIVKIGSDASHIAVPTAAADYPLGCITDDTAAAEDLANVQLFGSGVGTMKLTANAAITAGADVYLGAASGKVGPAPTGTNGTYWKVGRALNATSADNDFVEVQHCVPVKVQPQVITIPVTLAQITGAADVATAIPIGIACVITKIDAFVQNIVTTAAKLATLSLKINSTAVTGGAVALTSANCTPLGAKVAGTAITALNVMAATDTLSLVATGVTAFAEGAVWVEISYIPI